MNESLVAQPLIIIGAPRSGTNILRDVLASVPGIATWPCDEINYIWRHGNIFHPSDELPAELATPSIARYVRARFDELAVGTGAAIVAEKTCANALRVPFVDRILPEARYLYIRRDGIDAAVSASLRWKAKLDLPYILRKARYVPLSDMPFYAFRYGWSRLYRLFSRDERLAFWGPGLDNMEQILRDHELLEVCAIQWQACTEAAERALAELPRERVHRISYEDFVSDPHAVTERILAFLEHDTGKDSIAKAVAPVNSHSLGKARKALSKDQLQQLGRHILKT